MEEEATDFRRYSLGNRVFVYSIYLLVAVSLSISFYHYYPFDDLFVIATFLLTAGGIFFVFCIPIYIIHVIIVNNEKDSLKDYYCSLGDEIVFLQRSKLIRNFKSFKIPGKDKELENLFKFIGKISNQLRDVFSDDLKKLNRVKAKANLLDNLRSLHCNYIEYRLNAVSKVLNWKAPWYYYRLAKLVVLKNALTAKEKTK